MQKNRAMDEYASESHLRIARQSMSLCWAQKAKSPQIRGLFVQRMIRNDVDGACVYLRLEFLAQALLPVVPAVGPPVCDEVV